MSSSLDSLSKLKKLAARRGWFKDTSIVFQGFGPLAAHMFHHFHPVSLIVAEYYGQEVKKYIEEGWGTPVFSYEKSVGVRHCNSAFFNQHFYQDHSDEILAALKRLAGRVCFIPFAATPSLNSFLFSPAHRCRLIQNSSIMQNFFDYKARLAWSAKEIGIPLPPSAKVMQFGELEYQGLADSYPDGFVVQTPLSQAGGGTIFVFTEDDFRQMIDDNQKLLGGVFWTTPVKVTPFLSGPSLNCTGCVVNGAVACSPPDIQIVGDPYFVKTAGQYIGSDFATEAIGPEHREFIFDVLQRVGAWMGRRGFRGNFGIDFLASVDRQNRIRDIFVSEVNARLVGESQYMADWQAMKDSVPLTFFHLAEWLEIDEITAEDVEAYNRSLPALQGSALLLYTRQKGTLRAAGGLNSGIFTCQDGKLARRRDGYLLSETKSDDEFVVTNGIPWEGLVLGHPRHGDYNVFLCYILARESIVDSKNGRRVNRKWREIADVVYRAFQLVPCEPRLLPGENR